MPQQKPNLIPGYEYDLGNGTSAVWGGKAGWMTAEQYTAQKGEGETQVSKTRDLLRRIEEAKARAKAPFAGPLRTGTIGGATAWIPGTPGHNLQAMLKPLVSSTTLQTIGAAKGEGQSLGQNPTDKDADIYRTSEYNLDVGQDTGQFLGELDVARKKLLDHVPGASMENPIDLSDGSPRAGIPRGAFYRDPMGNIRRNDNGDAGNPVFAGPGKPKPAAPKQPTFKYLGTE